MDKPIVLHCQMCGRKMKYKRDIDPDIPAEVVRIESQCPKCIRGGFGFEWWYDAAGELVDQVT